MKVRGKKNWREGERELNQGNLENFFSFQFYFGKIFDESTWRFWKTKEELEREKESELNQGNLENFLSNSILGRFLIKVYGDFGKRKLEGRRI